MSSVYPWQHTLWQHLVQNRNFRGHALLLKGKRGIGKLDFANNFAKSLLCIHPTSQHEACGSCPSCTWFRQGGHPNFYQVVPAAMAGLSAEKTEKPGAEEKTSSAKVKKKPSQQISVEQIRLLTDFVYMSGHQVGYKIILIHPAEAMNLAAANALLKKLEEPPAHVLLILVTHHPQHLLPTIRSRCQQITMPIPDAAMATEWLKQQDIIDPESNLSAAGFAPLSALLLSETDYEERHKQFIEQIGMPNSLDPIQLAIAMQQWDLSMIVDWLQKWCYDILSFHTTGKVRYYLFQHTIIKDLAVRVDPKALVAFARDLMTTQQLSHHPLNSRLFLEEMLFSYVQMVNKHVRI